MPIQLQFCEKNSGCKINRTLLTMSIIQEHDLKSDEWYYKCRTKAMTYTTSSGKSVIKLTLVVLQTLSHCLPVIYTIHSYSHFDASTPVRIVFHNILICCVCSFWWLTLHNYNFSKHRRHWQTWKFHYYFIFKRMRNSEHCWDSNYE